MFYFMNKGGLFLAAFSFNILNSEFIYARRFEPANKG